MSDAWLRRLVVAAISLLIVYQVGTWIYAAFGLAAGIFSALPVLLLLAVYAELRHRTRAAVTSSLGGTLRR